MKSDRFTSQPLAMPRSSSPRLRNGTRYAFSSLLNLILKQSVLSFDLSLVPNLPAQIFPTAPLRELEWVYVDCTKSHFCLFRPKPLRS